MDLTRRNLVKMAAAAPFLPASSVFSSLPMADDGLRAELKESANLLGLPGFVAGVVRAGKLDPVLAEGFADLESQTPMRRDHIFYLASLTKTFTAVALMQYVQEGKLSLDDYLLDYPFLTVGFSPDRLLHPDVRLKHCLSHTSEGKPGDHYIYSGNRYNFLYGVFEEVSGNTRHYEAWAQEFRKRFEEPLGLTSTLAGNPADPKDPRISRIATPYFLDSDHKTPTRDLGAAGDTTLYPSTGLLSTVDDLSKYMIALDENTLLSAESYAHLTSPFKLNNGRLSTYGLGWSSQKIGGHSVHWHYGYGDSYSALLVRIPEKKASFIFLSNSGAASAPFLLGFGNLLTSPFAAAFIENVLPGTLTSSDRDFSRMFLLHYTESNLGQNQGGAKALLKKLCSNDPAHFHRGDWASIHLTSDLSDTEFSGEMERLIAAYRGTEAFHPAISLAIADFYERTEQQAKCVASLRQVADHAGYGEEKETRDACRKLGTFLLRNGKTEEGRRYLWQAAQFARTGGEPLAIEQELKTQSRRLKS